MTLTRSLRIALLCGAAAIFAVPAIGVTPQKAALLGTSRFHAGKPAVPATSDVMRVKPLATFEQAGYATGGIALRNRDGGVVHISGLNGIVRTAFVYWAYLLPAGVVPPATQPIKIERLFPVGAPPNIRTVTGTLIGNGGDPCWGSAGNAVYRARVPTTVATGNGYYRITLLKEATGGLTDGEDPWDGNVVFPAAEGASMALIGDGTSNVSVFDQPMSGTEFESGNPLNYKLVLPLAPTGGPKLFDAFGADGQIGASRLAEAGVTDETVTINGTIISGAGGLDPDSDWNGSSGFPLPQLWDDTGHDISVVTNPTGGPLTALNVTVTANGDCLIGVANIISY